MYYAISNVSAEVLGEFETESEAQAFCDKQGKWLLNSPRAYVRSNREPELLEWKYYKIDENGDVVGLSSYPSEGYELIPDNISIEQLKFKQE